MKIKTKVKCHILWKIQSRNSSFWWDNWTGKGPWLCYTKAQMVQHISTIASGNPDDQDFPIWNPTQDGVFSNNSAWHIIRNPSRHHRWKPFNICLLKVRLQDKYEILFGKPLGIQHNN